MTQQINFTPQVREFTVSEISQKIKNVVEQQCGYVRIKGEISGLKIATSGHGYLNLKDNNAILSAICWRHSLSRLEFKLEEGMEVVASGKITTYAGQSKYQLSIDRIEPSGTGALMKMLIERKTRLEKEGLFDKSKKKQLPFLPGKIGIVTSPTGAVIKDMLHRISDRAPCHVLLWPASVQGENASGEIVDAIKGFNNLESKIKPDVIIVARGGGSIEDLWAFNEEEVVRAIYESDIPVISAVGHETDFTLADFVSDVRAPTPTAAAEFALPVIEDLKYTVSQNFLRLKDSLSKVIAHKKQIIDMCDNIISDPMRLIRMKEQNLDHITFRLMDLVPNLLEKKAMKLGNITAQMSVPKSKFEMNEVKLSSAFNQFSASIANLLDRKNGNLDLQSKLLHSLNYNNVLKRGFSIVKSGEKIVTSTAMISSKEDIIIQMHDGNVNAVVKEIVEK